MLGLTAGTLTTLSFVPQIVKAWRSRSCTDLSLGMLLAFTAGVALWTIYGIVVGAPPIVATNAITLILALVLVGLKLRFR
jgi:MtN3 and saliva related transmembrane protein